MAAWSLKGISLGLSILPAFAGNAALRGAASAEESSRGTTFPSWCSNVPADSRNEIPDCGGITNAGSSTEGIPSWCTNVPPELVVAACTQKQAATSKDVQNRGVELTAPELSSQPVANVSVAMPVLPPSVDVPATDPNMLQAGSASPSWCNDIPAADQQYIAACGGSTGGNDRGAAGGAPPSWCENIPLASRAEVPSCVSQENAPLAAAYHPAGGTCEDFCWIHQGCSLPAQAGWSNTGSMGPGYYCNDGVYVDESSEFDSCCAIRNCPVPLTFNGERWECLQ